MSLFSMLYKMFKEGKATAKYPAENPPRRIQQYPPASPVMDPRGEELRRKIRSVLGGSLHIRHVDSGSCNGCDWEMTALLNPVYDIQRFGIDFVASPRHADMLLVTGGVTRHLAEALLNTWNACAEPKMIIAVGECAINGGVFGSGYAHYGGIDTLVPVYVSIPGCPPSPQELLEGILLAVGRLDALNKQTKPGADD